VVVKLGFFVEAAPLAPPDPPGDDDDVVVTQFLLLSPTLPQLGAAPTETAEIAITAANMAATVSSTSIRFTLIHHLSCTRSFLQSLVSILECYLSWDHLPSLLALPSHDKTGHCWITTIQRSRLRHWLPLSQAPIHTGQSS
jgi:hypothetical protein